MGIGKYLLFSSKGQQIFTTETGLLWDFVISQRKRSVQVLLRSLLSLHGVRVSNSVKRRAYLDFILKAVQRCLEDLAKSLSAFLFAKWNLFISLRLLLLSLLAQIFIGAILDCGSSSGSLLLPALPVTGPLSCLWLPVFDPTLSHWTRAKKEKKACRR